MFLWYLLFASDCSPFIAEQFRCDIPRDFHLLNIYVNEREKVSNKDKVIGRVSLSRGDILKFHAKEHWFNIDPVRYFSKFWICTLLMYLPLLDHDIRPFF